MVTSLLNKTLDSVGENRTWNRNLADKFYTVSDQHIYRKRQHKVHHFTCISGFEFDVCAKLCLRNYNLLIGTYCNPVFDHYWLWTGFPLSLLHAIQSIWTQDRIVTIMINSFNIFTVFEKKLEMTIVKCLSGILIALTNWAGLKENIQHHLVILGNQTSNDSGLVPIWDTVHMHMRKTDGNKQIPPHYRNKTIQSNL